MVGQLATVLGWGATTLGGSLSEDLEVRAILFNSERFLMTQNHSS